MNKPALSMDQYRSVLDGLATLLQRHIDPWGNVERDHIAQELQGCWEKTVAWFRQDYPQASIPAAPWSMGRQRWVPPSSLGGGSASSRSN